MGSLAMLARRCIMFEYRWYVVMALTLVNIVNQIERSSIAYLASVSIAECSEICADVVFTTICVECSSSACSECTACRIANDAGYYNLLDGTCLTETQYGMTVGLGFSIPFGVFGLIAGLVVDRFRHRIVFIFSSVAIIWSSVMIGMSSAYGYKELLSWRILQGIWQAFQAPCAYTLLAGFFSGADRATVNGVYSLGTYLGAGLGSLYIIMALAVGWRSAAKMSGYSGIMVALCVGLSVKRPAVVSSWSGRGGAFQTAAKGPVTAAYDEPVSEALSNPIYLMMVACASLRYFGGCSLLAYGAIYFSRAFPNDNETFAIVNALATTVGGSLSSYLGGVWATQWAKDEPGNMARFPGVGTLAACPFLLAAIATDSLTFSMVMLFMTYLLGECWLGPAVAIIQNCTSQKNNGVAVAVYIVVISFVGSLSVNFIAHFDPGTDGVRDLLAAVFAVTYVGSAAMFYKLAGMLSMRARNEDTHLPPYGGEMERLIPPRKPLAMA